MDNHKSESSKIKPKTPVKTEKPRQKVPKKITETYLHNSGLYYLERFAVSKAQFIRTMMRKVKKSCLHHKDQNESQCSVLVETLANKFEQSGLLNDALFTQGQISSLRRRGFSRRAILDKLSQKGIKHADIMEKLEQYESENDQTQDPDLTAALILARKKKIGPFQKDKKTDPKKAMAALARAGFSYKIARQIIDIHEEDMGY